MNKIISALPHAGIRLKQFCFLLFPLVFGCVFLSSFVRGNSQILLLAPAAGLGGLFLLLSRKLLPRLDRFSPRGWAFVFRGGLTLMLIFMLATGFSLCNDNWSTPFDSEALYRTAVQLAQGLYPDYNEYFVCTDNNFGCMLLLYGFYRVLFLLGLPLSPYAGMILNGVLLWLAPVFVCLTAYRLWGRRGGALSLLLCFCFLPYYIFVPFIYTDTMGAPLVALCIWQAVRLWQGWDAATLRLRVWGLCFCGTLLGLAFLMKGNSILLCIALPLWLFGVRPRGKSLQKLGASALALIVCAGVIFAVKVYEHSSGILDFSAYDAVHMPTSHWLMMGLENNGMYNDGSFAYSGSFSTLESRKEAIALRLGENIRTLVKNPVALAWLMATKAETCWTDGLYTAPVVSGMSLIHRGTLAEWFLQDGTHAPFVLAFGQSFYWMLWGGAIFASLRAFRRVREQQDRFILLPVLCLLGNFCFFCLWEANQRYTFNFSCCLLLLFTACLMDSIHSYSHPPVHKEEVPLG